MSETPEAQAAPKTSDERKASLARRVSNELARGYRVESQSDYQAVLIKGRHVRHVLHLVLSLITAGLWVPVWIAMWLIYREQREIVDVNEYGNTSVSGV